jgi:hypothetical protein
VLQTLRTLDDSCAAPQPELNPNEVPKSRAEGMAERWRRDAG